MKLREGDKVKVIAGKDKGKESRIIKMFPTRNKAIVENVNTAKKHQRPLGEGQPGGIIDKDMPIDVSNLMLICKDCGPTRTGYTFDADGNKHRSCKKCGGAL